MHVFTNNWLFYPPYFNYINFGTLYTFLQVQATSVLKPVRKVYQEIINTDEGGPRHAITTPRDYKQVMKIIRILKAYYNRES